MQFSILNIRKDFCRPVRHLEEVTILSEEVVRRLERSRGNNIHPSLFKQLGREAGATERKCSVKKEQGTESKMEKSEWCSFGYNRASSRTMLAKHTSNVLRRRMIFHKRRRYPSFETCEEKITRLMTTAAMK